MDGSRFDNITKSLAQGTTRRRVLKGLAGAVAGALVGSHLTETDAACPPGSVTAAGGRCICKNTGRAPVDGSCTSGGGGGSGGGGTTCSAGQTLCGTACVDASSDLNNCGACGRICSVTNHATDVACLAGQCWVASCAPGWADCNATGFDGCETQLGTNQNCAACGNACTGFTTCGGGGIPGICGCSKLTCQPGQCGPVPDGCGGTLNCTACPTGQTCTAGGCKTNDGGACSGNGDCASGVCVSGICCNQACNGECRSCATGTCQDRAGACGPSGACGGTCQAGQCVTTPINTPCGDATCSPHNAALSASCDGAGHCVESTQHCGLSLCRDGACLTSCQTSADCIGQAFCSDGVCYGDLPAGNACTSDDQCQSGKCAGGFCTSGGVLGSPCATGTDCSSGNCAHGVCCERPCSGACEVCPGGTCRLIPAGDSDHCGTGGDICQSWCDGIHSDCVYPGADISCGANRVCDGNGSCVGTIWNGGLCDTDAECRSGHCIGDSAGIGTCCTQDCPEQPHYGLSICVNGGTTCTVRCDTVFTGGLQMDPCGDICCLRDVPCCTSLDGQTQVCCAIGAECIDGQCTAVCSPKDGACDPNHFNIDCCPEHGVICGNDFTGRGPFCGSAPGYPCPASHDPMSSRGCPSVNDPSGAGFETQVFCGSIGTPGEGICGGGGALCYHDLGCASDQCCNGICCSVGEICTQTGCAPIVEICTSAAQCKVGQYCCNGACVDPSDDHCSSCTDVCPANTHCKNAGCRKVAGQPCTDGAQCFHGFCYDGVCCDECGGRCGKERPDGTACIYAPLYNYYDPSHHGCCGGFCALVPSGTTPHDFYTTVCPHA